MKLTVRQLRKIISEAYEKPKGYDVTVHVTNGAALDGLQVLLVKLDKLGRGGHSFGVQSDDNPRDVEGGNKLGGWDGDGGARIEKITVKDLDRDDEYEIDMETGKKKKGELKEDYLRGIPEFQFQEATRKFVGEIKSYVKSFILVDKSTSKEEQADAISAMNDQMSELEEAVNVLLEEKLWKFTERV